MMNGRTKEYKNGEITFISGIDYKYFLNLYTIVLKTDILNSISIEVISKDI